MKIKAKLRILAILPLLVFVTAIAIHYWTQADLERRYVKRQRVGQVSLVSMRLVTLAYEYGITRGDRAVSQWDSQYAEEGRLLQEVETLLDRPDEQPIIADLWRSHKTAGKLFAELLLQDKTQDGGTMATPRLRLRSNVLNRVILELQGVLPITEQIYAEIDANIQRSIRQGALLTAAVVLVLALCMVAIALWVAGGITSALFKFQQGIGAVAGGDLSYRINLDSRDEFGELARGFDAMAGKLTAVTVSRDALAREIEERRRTQAALAASEEKLKEAQRIARFGSWSLDIVTNTLVWSDEIFRIFEIDPKLFGATYEAFLNCIHPEDRERVNQAYTNSLNTRQPYEIEHRLLMPDGRIKFVHERCETEFDADNSPLRSIGTVQDITEQKRAAEEIQQLNAELELRVGARTRDLEAKSREVEAGQLALMNIVEDLNNKTVELESANVKLLEVDRLKSMFIAAMSHELRTPLNSIIGFSSIVQEEWLGPLNPEQKAKLGIVLRTGKHLLALINDLIDISKIEAGKVEIAEDDFDLHDLIVEAAALSEADLATRGIALRVEAVHQTMHADRKRLFQCVVNLLGNAVKFTRQGAITVKAELVRDTKAPGAERVIISVIDTGIGIREEDLSKLFSSFVRLPLPEDMQVKGTGLGLYLVKKIVTEILGGTVGVSSTIGQGSTFSISIPVRETQGRE